MNTKKSPFKFLVILTVIIVATLIALVIIANQSSNSSNDISFENAPSIEGQPILGNPDAPVTVVEFGDYKCPACKVWSLDYLPQLMQDYIESGQVKFAYVNVFFHGQESVLGSLAAESIYSQDPDAYWQFHKQLFNAQPEVDHDVAWITEELILDIASTIPTIDIELLISDMENQTQMAEIERDQQLVEEFKIELTPSVMVNGTMLEDPFDYEKIMSLIEKEL